MQIVEPPKERERSFPPAECERVLPLFPLSQDFEWEPFLLIHTRPRTLVHNRTNSQISSFLFKYLTCSQTLWSAAASEPGSFLHRSAASTLVQIKVLAARGAAAMHEYSGGWMWMMKGSTAKQVTCGNGLGHLKENMSLAAPFKICTSALEVNFTSGSTFGFVYGVGGTLKNFLFAASICYSIVSAEQDLDSG